MNSWQSKLKAKQQIHPQSTYTEQVEHINRDGSSTKQPINKIVDFWNNSGNLSRELAKVCLLNRTGQQSDETTFVLAKYP